MKTSVLVMALSLLLSAGLAQAQAQWRGGVFVYDPEGPRYQAPSRDYRYDPRSPYPYRRITVRISRRATTGGCHSATTTGTLRDAWNVIRAEPTAFRRIAPRRPGNGVRSSLACRTGSARRRGTTAPCSAATITAGAISLIAVERRSASDCASAVHAFPEKPGCLPACLRRRTIEGSFPLGCPKGFRQALARAVDQRLYRANRHWALLRGARGKHQGVSARLATRADLLDQADAQGRVGAYALATENHALGPAFADQPGQRLRATAAGGQAEGASGRPNSACSSAMRRSQARAHSSPPPKAKPLIAAMETPRKSRSASKASPNRRTISCARIGSPSANCCRSAPALKKRSPWPVMTSA